MNLEPVLMYGLAVAAGWLLRHVGIGGGFKLPGLAPGTPSATSTRLPVMTTLKADIDQIVKSAVEAAVKQAIDDIKSAAILQGQRQAS